MFRTQVRRHSPGCPGSCRHSGRGSCNRRRRRRSGWLRVFERLNCRSRRLQYKRRPHSCRGKALYTSSCRLLHRFERRESLAAAFDREFVEGIARAGRRRPKTSILVFGRDGSTSFQVLFGLAISLPPSLFPSGTCFARAKNICFKVTFIAAIFGIRENNSVVADLDFDNLADTILAHFATSDFLIREALLTSGCSTPTPEQNNLRPPPDPVDRSLAS